MTLRRTQATPNGPTDASTKAGSRRSSTPNTEVIYTHTDGKDYDVDWNNWQEGKNGDAAGASTYAAVTSRSYHSGGVNTARADGSVDYVTENIDLFVWQALATRNGVEVITQ